MLHSLPEKPTMHEVSRLETSLVSTSMPPRRAMATTVKSSHRERRENKTSAERAVDTGNLRVPELHVWQLCLPAFC